MRGTVSQDGASHSATGAAPGGGRRPAGRIGETVMLALVATIFVFPSSTLAELGQIGLPGSAYEWMLIAAWAAALVLVVWRGRIGWNRDLILLTTTILVWCLFLIVYSLLTTDHSPKEIFWDVIPYLYWTGLALPLCLGVVSSWRSVLYVATGAAFVALAVGAYALLFNHALLLRMWGEPAIVERYQTFSFRLPISHGFLYPWIMLGWIRRYQEGKRSLSDLLVTGGVLAALLLAVVASQSRTVLVGTVLSLFLLAPRGGWASIPRRLAYAVGLVAVLTAGFVVLSEYNEVFAERIERRFVEPLEEPRLLIEEAYESNRDVLYAYSLETLHTAPLLGRGLGDKIPTGRVGRTTTRQDVSLLNHLDKSGLLGVLLFLAVHLYLYLQIRRVYRHGHSHYGAVEDSLRRLFVQFYPLLALMSLNIDVFFSRPFMILHGVLVGSLILETERTATFEAPAGTRSVAAEEAE